MSGGKRPKTVRPLLGISGQAQWQDCHSRLTSRHCKARSVFEARCPCLTAGRNVEKWALIARTVASHESGEPPRSVRERYGELL